MLYPKIQTLWKRDQDTGIIIPQNYSKDEFLNIKMWHVTEKVDGMNVRVQYNRYIDESLKIAVLPTVKFGGRTDKAQMPGELMQYLERVFRLTPLNLCFPDATYVCLFGEGYGPKIQGGGGLYTDKQEFILFDVFVDGWWLKQDAVSEIARFFGIPRVPELGIWTKERAMDFVDPRVNIYTEKNHLFTGRTIPKSVIAQEEREMEGVMCRSHPLMLFRNRTPIQFKLKVKDFKRLMK